MGVSLAFLVFRSTSSPKRIYDLQDLLAEALRILEREGVFMIVVPSTVTFMLVEGEPNDGFGMEASSITLLFSSSVKPVWS